MFKIMCGRSAGTVSALLLVLFTFFAAPASAADADQCRDILNAGLFNESRDIRQADTMRALYDSACNTSYDQLRANLATSAFQFSHLCDMNYQEAKSHVAASASGKYQMIFKAGGSFSQEEFNIFKSEYCSTFQSNATKNQSSFREWQRNYCRTVDDRYRDSSYLYSMRKTVSASVIEAWSACMQRSGSHLTCHGEKQGDHIALDVKWSDDRGEHPKVNTSYLSSSARVANQTVQQGRLFREGERINFGTNVRVIEHIDKFSPVYAMVEVTAGTRFNASCRMYVPEDLENADLRGNWALSNGSLTIDTQHDDTVRGGFRLLPEYAAAPGFDLAYFEGQILGSLIIFRWGVGDVMNQTHGKTAATMEFHKCRQTGDFVGKPLCGIGAATVGMSDGRLSMKGFWSKGLEAPHGRETKRTFDGHKVN